MENGNQHSQQPTTSPCIYVACLASYSSGILHGVWIAADQIPRTFTPRSGPCWRNLASPSLRSSGFTTTKVFWAIN